MDIEINEVNEIIKNLEGSSELSIKEEKYLKVAKLCVQLAAENVGLTSGFSFFMHSPDAGFETYKTRDEAINAANEMIDEYRGDAGDGWPEEVEQTVWGVIIQHAVQCDIKKPSEENRWEGSCDYKLLPEPPATSAYLAGIKADGVEEFLKGSQLPYQIATVLADYDNADDETLHHVIWSGQPPEPDGDVWHLEYVSRGNAIVREVLNRLREGDDK